MSTESDLTRTAIIPRLLQLQDIDSQEAGAHPWQPWLDLDLTMPQFKLLLLVASANGARVGDLAQKLGVTPPSVTTILDRLVDHGFVRRENDPIDRRLVIVRLTPQSHTLLARLNIHTDSDLIECLNEMTEEDLRSLLRGMEALRRIWETRSAVRANGVEPEAC